MKIDLRWAGGAQVFEIDGGQLTVEFISDFHLAYRHETESYAFEKSDLLVVIDEATYKPDLAKTADLITYQVRHAAALFQGFS